MIDPKATHPENTRPRAWADPTDSLLLETRPARTFSMKYISGSLPRGSGGSQLRTTYVLLVSEACTLVGGPGIWTSPGGGGNTVSAGRSRSPTSPAHPGAGPSAASQALKDSSVSVSLCSTSILGKSVNGKNCFSRAKV